MEPKKPAFSEEQAKELSDHLTNVFNTAVAAARTYTDKAVVRVATAERERIAILVETFQPFSDTEHDDVLVPKGEIVDWGKSLKALADAIRSGRHD
jgi:hypothetical protein